MLSLMFKTKSRMNSGIYISSDYSRLRATSTQFESLSIQVPTVGNHDGDMSETKFTERQQEILNLIKESPTVTGKRFPIRVSKMRRNTAMET